MKTLSEKLKESFDELTRDYPSWNNVMFISNPHEYKHGNTSIEIMYDSMICMNKTVYENTKGAYIKGRATSGEGVIQLNLFKYSNGESFSYEENESVKQKLEEGRIKQKELDEEYGRKTLSTKLIQFGTVFKKDDYGDYYLIYLGTVKYKKKTKYLFLPVNKPEFKNGVLDSTSLLTNTWSHRAFMYNFEILSSKRKPLKIIDTVSDDILIEILNKIETNGISSYIISQLKTKGFVIEDSVFEIKTRLKKGRKI